MHRMYRSIMGLALPLAAAASVHASPVVFTTEHLDYLVNFRTSDNTFLLTVRDENNRVEYGGGDYTLAYHGSNTQATIPPLAAYAFLGPEGSPIWIGPQVLESGKPYNGFSSENKVNQSGWTTVGIDDPSYRGLGIPSGVFVGNQVQIRLVDFDGPGNFALWQTGGFGVPDVLMRTHDGLSTADAVTLFPGTHAHYNWGFTETGLYKFTFQVFGTLVSTGEVVTSDPTSFYFGVETMQIPEPASAALAVLGAAAVLMRRRQVS